MATDNTTNQTETANNASAIHESDVEQVHLTQSSGTPVQVQVPQGANVVRIQVTPGETVELPFPTDGLVARLGDNGNLAVKVGDVTVILLGYAEATGQGEITILGNDGKSLDVAAVLASTDPNLDIQTAAGGAADQGTGVDNNGGVFSPFDPNTGIGGLNAIGGLQATALQYNLIERDRIIFEVAPDEVDTTPTVVNITQAPPVNEDDLHGPRCDENLIDRLTPDPDPEVEEGGEQPALQSFSEKGGEPKWVLAHEYEDGNDPFDTKDHEEGSQTDFNGDGKSELFPFISDDSNGPFPGGIDKDREPLTVQAVVEANFFADLPGKLVLDANGNGINDGPGDVPLIDQLEGMGLTSHGHELTYKLLPEIPESAPGANDGTGQMVVAYYTVIKYGCPTNVVVFTIGVDDDVVNAGETNPAGNAEFGISFTIYGVVDHPEKGGGTDEGNGIEDILKIEVPFFLQDVDSPPVPSDFPQPLEFQDIDDMPFLGEVCYASFCGFDVPIAITKANLTIGHDETPGDQSTWYDSNLQPHAPNWLPDQETDDVGGWLGNVLAWKADNQLDDIAGGEASGEDTDLSYQQDILAQLSNEFLNNGNFCAEPLGVAKTYLDVSFGADGKAKGDDQAGNTLFQHDNKAGEGTDNSQKTYDSNGNLIGNDDGGTDKQAFELFMKNTDSESATAGQVLDKSATNWTITVMVNGEPVTLTVYAFQLDANTIIGMASPSGFEGGQDEGDGIQILRGAVGNDIGGIDGEGDAVPVFMLRLDPESGQLVFVQYHQINNPEGGNAAHPDWDQSSNDPIHLYDADGNPLVFFQATDFDGDTVTSQLEVSVIDDAPDAKDDKAVLDEENAGVDGELNKVTGNLVLGVSNDGVNNDNGKDKLSVDHDHTIPALKYGNSTITFDFLADTFNVTGSDATNVTFDGHTVEFDTPYGHFKVVVDGDHSDPNGGDSPLETDELGYYEYTSKPGNNSDKDQYGLETTANGTVDPTGANDSAKILSLLQSFGTLTLSNNAGGVDNNAANWGFKTIDAAGKHYSGIAVGGGIDGGETDTNGSGQVATEVLTIKFPNDVDSAKITVGALFDGQLHDNGNAEALKWEAWDGNTKVGEGVIYGGKNGLVEFFINLDDDFDKVTLQPLDNGTGNSGNNSDFLLVGVKTCDELCITEQLQYKLQDADGDYDTAKLTIDVLDGEPKITSCEADLSITIDEDGLPNGNNNNVNSPSGDASDNVGGDNGPGDADGKESTAQGHITYNTYADGLGGVFLSSTSSLTTLDGKSITWAWDPSLNRLVGYATPDTDRIVVEVLLSNANDSGVDFKIVMHEPLDHPVNSTEDNLYLDIKVTVTDKDCDIDTANIHVKIDDDVPTVTIQALVTGTVDIDESFGDQRDDQNNNNAPQSLKNVSNSGSIIEYAKDGDPVVSVNAHFGADGAAVSGAVAYAVSASSAGVDSGLDFKDANGNIQNIVLTTENGVVVGRVSGGPDAGKAVFAVTIDQNGELEVAQYRPIHHNNTGSNDESLSILNGALQVTVTVTDGDGDKAATSAGIGDKVSFYDDGPSVSSNDTVVVEDDDLPGGIDGGPGDDSAPNNATGTLAHSYGTDGAGTTLLTNANLPGGQGFTQSTSPDGKTLTISQNGTPVLQIVLTNTTSGNYTVTQLAPIKHPNGNDENNVEFTVNYQVKDNDGDTVNGTMKINVDDDTPTAEMSSKNEGSVILETQDAQTIGANFDTASSAANFSGVFSFNKSAGADGEQSSSVSYGLNVNSSSSGMQIGGVNINLFKVGNDVIGTTAGSGGAANAANTVFKIEVDSNGVVKVTQFQQIDHGNPETAPSYDDDVRTLANGKVSLTATGTVTDKDNDSASDSETIDLGGNIKFDDDGPNAVNEASALVIASLNTTTNGTNLLLNDTVGADTPGTLTQVVFTNGAQNVAGGAGSDFFVDAAGNRLASAAGSVGILHIEQDGDWSFKQTATSATDVTFTYKLVDKDGDSDTATFSVDLKNVPPPSFTFASANVDEDGLVGGFKDDVVNVDGQPGDNVTGAGGGDSSEKTFGGTFGLGAQAITAMSLADNVPGDFASVKNLSGVAVDSLVFSNGNLTMIAKAGGVELFKVEITNVATGDFKVTLLNPVQHTNPNSEDDLVFNIKVSATNDGGTSSAGIQLTIDDDRPSLALSTQAGPSLTVDETGIYGPAAVASVAGLFTNVNFGADGAAAGGGLAYKLTGAGGVAIADGTGTGLTDLNGNAIQLFNVGGAIQGKVVGGPNNGVIVFQVSISGSNVQLQQVWPIKHVAGNPDDPLSATANLIYVTATATDKDGDTTSLTSSSALGLTFKDDGPDAVDDNNAVVTIGTPVTGNVTNNDSSGADVKTGFAKGEVTGFVIDGNPYAADGLPHAIPGHGTMTMDSHGNYSFTQTDGAAGTMDVTYTLRDGDGDTDTAVLHIATVADIAPINFNDANEGNESVSQDTNVMIILDVSGSMNDDADGSGPGTLSRLDVSKAALIQLLNAYDALGEVRVTIVSFTTGAQIELAWSNVAAAIAEINTFTPQDLTNYQAAVETADNAWVAPGKLPDAQNIVYFLSDGNPTTGGSGADFTGNHLTSGQKDVWDTFLENPTNGIDKVYAVAIGDGISGDESNPDSDLKDIADPDGNDSPDGQVIYVNDPNELAAELVGTVVNLPIAGNVLTGVDTSGVGDTGVLNTTPDAPGNGTTFVNSFVYDSANNAFDVSFSWDGVSAACTAVGGTNVVINGHLVSFDTGFGKMTFNFDTGAYSFAPGSVTADTDVKFHYTTKDADGDTDLADAAGGGGDDDAVPGNSLPGGADLVITIHNVVAPPAITSIDDNVGSIQGVVPDNGVTDDTVLVLHGTSDAGSLVKVYDGLTYLGDAISDGLGNWTFTTAALANGTDHHFNATATLGTTSAPSGNYDVTIDTTAPTVVVNIVDASQSDSNSSSVVTFIFSEVPVAFSAVDVAAVGGTVTGLTQDLGSDPSGKTWTATFNAADNFEGNATVSVTNGSYSDAAGNAGNFNFDAVPVDRINPTVAVNIVDASLSDADTSSEVRFVFSEVPTGFSAVDISAANGIVSGLTQNLGLDPSGKTYTATFTKTAGVNGVGSVSVTAGSYADAAGNTGGGGSDTVTISGNTAPQIGQDYIITNQTGVVTVLDEWLLRNDIDTETPNALTITSATTSDSDNYDVTPNHSGSSITFTLDTTNGSGAELSDGESTVMTYILSDGSLTDNSPNVTVTYNQDNSLSGTNNSEVFIGTSATESFSGSGGDDIFVGNGGADTYNGGSGSDTVVLRASVTTIVSGGGGNFEDGDFEGIEVIDLGVGHDAVVLGAASAGNRLNADDVLNITDNAGTALFIKGDASDSLFIDNSGGDALTVSGTQDQAGFTHYTGTSGGNTVHLYVDTDIVVNAGA